MGEGVRVERVGPVLRLTIDRPEQRNALNDDVIEGLLGGLAADRDDPQTRVVVLTGAGDRAFCAGGDLTSTIAPGQAAAHERRGRIGSLLLSLMGHPKPVVARVNGHAIAGGFGLMLACDLVVAVEDARFGTPEPTLGLWPFMISAVMLRNLPRKVAMELMLTGRRMTAAEAERLGIVNRVVPAVALDGAIDEVVDQLVRIAPLTVRLGKESLLRSDGMGLEASFAYLNAMLTAILETEDVAEGIQAFLQKRPPDWKGR
jgi:enoyl-CoA hydratase